MAFPSSPVNGQSATVNGIAYTYNSTVRSWTRSTSAQTSNPAIYVGTATATTAPTLVDTLPTTGNVFLRWTVTAKDTVNNRFTSTVVDSINDGTNVYYTQYGTIKSNQSYNVATFTSNISGGNVNLYAVGDSATVSVTYERLTLGTSTTTGYINAGPAGPAGPAGSGNITAVLSGNTYVSANLIPTSNIAYDIGTTTQRFRSLYLSGNTIDLGGATIKTDVTSGAIALVPLPTTTTPNPVATVLHPGGGVTTVVTTGGTIATGALSTAANAATTSGGNLTVGNLTINTGIFYANGVAFTSSSYSNVQVAAYLPTYTGNITAGNLTVSGTVSTASLTETSSLQLKENIRPIEDPFEVLLQLAGVIYDRKDGSSFDEPGLIAEAVAVISAALVSKNTNGEIEGVKYTRIIAYLIEAIKRLKDSETQNNKTISDLVNSVKKLETEISLLKGGIDGNT